MISTAPLIPGPILAGLRLAPDYGCNSGGPMSRTRTERLYTTVLGEDDGPIRCPRVLRVGLAFGRRKPLRCVERWLREAGFGNETEARAVITLPPGPARLIFYAPSAADGRPLHATEVALTVR